MLPDMRINFGGSDLIVSEKSLYQAEFHSVFQKVRGDAVAQGVDADFGQLLVC